MDSVCSHLVILVTLLQIEISYKNFTALKKIYFSLLIDSQYSQIFKVQIFLKTKENTFIITGVASLTAEHRL